MNQKYYTNENPDYTPEYTPEYTFGGFHIEDELFSSELEGELFQMFDELDAIVLDNLPMSLVTEPVKLIQQEYYQKRGLFLTKQEVVDAYLRYAEGVCYE